MIKITHDTKGEAEISKALRLMNKELQRTPKFVETQLYRKVREGMTKAINFLID